MSLHISLHSEPICASPTISGSVDEIARAIALGYRVVVRPDGTVEIEASGKADHGFAMDAVENIGVLAKEPYYQEYVRAEAQRIIDQAQASSVALPEMMKALPDADRALVKEQLPILVEASEPSDEAGPAGLPPSLAFRNRAFGGMTCH